MGDAWDLAAEAADRAGIRIAPLRTLEDLERVDAVIRATWGAQVLGREVLRAFQHAGCIVLGATDASGERADLVGFVFGFLGFDGGIHVHSHMLAVVPEWQSRGAGLALKLAQRAACLDLEIDDVRWTFDPLLARNAWFNLAKLGAVGTRFLPDFYGEMRDEINRGERTDRVELFWSVASERVTRAIGSSAPASDIDVAGAVALLGAMGPPDAPRPAPTGAKPGERALVAIPRDHLDLRRRDPGLGRAWREAAAVALRACFDGGLVATAFTRGSAYLFERPGGTA